MGALFDAIIFARYGCKKAGQGSRIMSLSLNRLRKNGSTASKESGPPMLRRIIAILLLKLEAILFKPQTDADKYLADPSASPERS